MRSGREPLLLPGVVNQSGLEPLRRRHGSDTSDHTSSHACEHTPQGRKGSSLGVSECILDRVERQESYGILAHAPNHQRGAAFV